jgi:lipid-A-disaccharide synthase-like uncharacterized protein
MTARTAAAGLALVLLASAPILAAPHVVGGDAARQDPTQRSIEMRVKPLPEGVRKVELEVDPDGVHWYRLQRFDGSSERVSPEAFAAAIDRDTRHRSFLYRLLNITSVTGIAWVGLGLLGQVLFTGRMVLQWLVSERERRSVVPVAFWWMSLGGATMLMVYFTWRRDIVGVLGQSTGWLIYVRNLWLIYRERLASTSTAA